MASTTKHYKSPPLTLSPLGNTAEYDSFGGGLFFFDLKILREKYPDAALELVLTLGIAHLLSNNPELELVSICPVHELNMIPGMNTALEEGLIGWLVVFKSQAKTPSQPLD